jgi:peptidoglycan hydrolase-like protein with peptidoglycan-binding domain
MRKALAVMIVAVFLGPSNVAAAAEGGPTPADITFVQGLLKRLGFDPGPLDGICGDQTVRAVRSFHESHNLPLKPSEIEPQAATVVQNLTTVFADYVIRPQSSSPEQYRRALEGDAVAALDVGTMYSDGVSGPADQMLAYVWYTVAEMNGNVTASWLKRELAVSGAVSDHEMTYAKALAAKIDESTDSNDIEKSKDRNGLRSDPTM